MASSHPSLTIICHEEDKMTAETIQAAWKNSPAASEDGDEHFNIVSRASSGFGSRTSLKAKGNFDEAATERLQASHARFHNSVAAADNKAFMFSTAAVSTGIAAAIVASSSLAI